MTLSRENQALADNVCDALEGKPPGRYGRLAHIGASQPVCSDCGALVGWEVENQAKHDKWHEDLARSFRNIHDAAAGNRLLA